MSAIDNDRCAACRRLFDSRSKPRWAFDAETGAPLGQIHTTCGSVSHGFRVLWGDFASRDEAQIVGWERYWRSEALTRAETDAFCSFQSLDGTISDAEDADLTALIRRRPDWTARRVVELADTWRGLVAEFRQWQASLTEGASDA